MEGKFVIIIAVALFFIALVQLMKIYDLAAKVRGAKSQEKVTRGENMLMANLMLFEIKKGMFAPVPKPNSRIYGFDGNSLLILE